MDSTSIVVLSICSVLVLSALIISLLLVKGLWDRTLTTISTLAQRSEAEREKLLEQWAKERNDLLNRLMTKEWTSYAQLSGTSPSNSETQMPEETDRGTGEVLIDLD